MRAGPLVRRARGLRRDATEAEARLWRALRRRLVAGAKFRRQEPVGAFIPDFVCAEARLVVEVDGGQHAGSAADARRDAWLAARGFEVVRYWNHDVLRNLDGVLDDLASRLAERRAKRPLTPTLSRRGERGRERPPVSPDVAGVSASTERTAGPGVPSPLAGEGQGEGACARARGSRRRALAGPGVPSPLVGEGQGEGASARPAESRA